MSAPFALKYTRPREAEPETPFTYNADRQLNVCADGSLAAENYTILMGTAATSSTAGSKTHSDDD
ncbi:putative ATP-grasp-modified RiPP [Streptomyces sp. NPDC127051]|uniref:putative ATP-grasp-modified RiPP n=1 Tax=Streptomyces sp. NPDC127051 TaxID=3347119 RepID=UPI00364EDB70